MVLERSATERDAGADMGSYFSKMGRPPLVTEPAFFLWHGSFREKLWNAPNNDDRLVEVRGELGPTK